MNINNSNDKLIKDLIEWIKVIITALVCAFIITNFIITNSQIPTPSMETTLPVGTRLFGFRLNYLFTDIKRGDVVIFDYGYHCRNCKKMFQKNEDEECLYCNTKLNFKDKLFNKVYFIKRVIGLPGEHLEIKSDYNADSSDFNIIRIQNGSSVPCGHVYINGQMLEEDYIAEPMIVDNNQYKSLSVDIPEDSYFLMGDNRNNSDDARFWPNKFLTKKDIESKAYFIYWPFKKFGLIK